MNIPAKSNTTWPEHTAVLIPAYKAEKSLGVFLPLLLEKVPGNRICVVDDASADDTGAVCARYAVECLKQEVNQGKGAALTKGFEHLTKKSARWILTMDADGQHSVEDLPRFIEAINHNPDAGLIIGARSIKLKSMPLARIFSNAVTSAIVSLLCGKKIPDSQCGYRLYSAELLKKINLRHKRFEMESEVILKASAAGFAIRSVPVRTLYCSTQSHISHVKDMLRWIRAVIGVWIELKRS